DELTIKIAPSMAGKASTRDLARNRLRMWRGKRGGCKNRRPRLMARPWRDQRGRCRAGPRAGSARIRERLDPWLDGGIAASCPEQELQRWNPPQRPKCNLLFIPSPVLPCGSRRFRRFDSDRRNAI